MAWWERFIWRGSRRVHSGAKVMANRTIEAYVDVLDVAKREIEASQSGGQIVGIFGFDAVRQKALLKEAQVLLDIQVCDTPETHPDVVAPAP